MIWRPGAGGSSGTGPRRHFRSWPPQTFPELAAARRRGDRAAVLDAPTLFESGADRLCDTIVVVTASPGIRQFRIMNRDGLSPEEAQNRMNSQQDEAFYVGRADHILRNDEDSAALRLQVLELMNRLGL